MAGRPVTDGGTLVPTYAINGRKDEIIDLEPLEDAAQWLLKIWGDAP